MSNGGGSINLRISLKGAEEAKTALASIGPAGAKMARELDRAMRQPAPGIKALDVAAGEARKGVDNLAGQAGFLGAGLSQLGGIGLAAAASLGVLAIGLTKARESMAWAAEITDVADRIGVSTTALQGWRYVADEAGVSTQSLEANMEKLNASVGAFKSGVGDAKLKPVFEALGITADELSKVQTADQMLLVLADTLGQVQDRAVQVRFAKALGVEESLPILRRGSDGIRELTAEFERLGLETGGDVVQALDAADRQMEVAQQRIDASMRLAVVGLADDFAELVGEIASVIAMLARLDQSLQSFTGGDGSKTVQRGLPGLISDTVRRRTGAEGDQARDEGIRNQPGWMTRIGINGQRREYLDRRDRERGEMAAGLNDLANGTGEYASRRPGWERQERAAGGGSGGRSSADRDGERRRREAEREIERLRLEELRAADDNLRRTVREGSTPEIRGQAARLLAESERAQEVWNNQQQQKILEDGNAWDEEQALRQENIQGLRDMAREDEERRRVEQEHKAQADALAEAEKSYVDITADILSLASASARTSAERREIELELLSIAQGRQRADLEAQIAASEEGPARQRLVAALNLMTSLHSKEQAEVSRRNSGPLGEWRDAQFQSWGEISEHMQGEALDALDGMNAGLREAWKNAENAGDAFAAMGDVAVDALGRVVDALMDVAIQKLLIEPLVNGIFGPQGGSGGSGGGIFGSFLGSIGGSLFGGGAGAKPGGGGVTVTGKKGFGRGGLVGASGLYPVGEYGMEFAELPVGSRIHDTERTERLVTAMSQPMRTPFASPAPMSLTVINKGEPMKATTSDDGQGGQVLTLEPVRQLVRGAVREMGGDGSLMSSLNATPRPRRR